MQSFQSRAQMEKAARTRHVPFDPEYLTTGNSIGYMITDMVPGEDAPDCIRLQRGLVTLAEHRSGTLFRTRRNAQTVLRRIKDTVQFKGHVLQIIALGKPERI